MQNLIGIILQVVLLLWKHKGKTTFAAVLAAATGGGTYAWLESQRHEPEVMAFHGGAGVPTSPPGVVPNDTPADGEYIKWVDPTGAEWAAGGGGAGLTYETPPTDGQIGAFDDTTNEYVPTYPGPSVHSARAPRGGLRAGGVATKTTGSVTGASDQLTVAAAAGFEPGQGIVVRGAGTTNSVGAPSAPLAAVMTQSFTSVATSNITTASGTVPYAAGSQFQVATTAADLPSGLSTATDYYWCYATQATTNTNSNVFELSTDQSTGLVCGDAVKIESTGTITNLGSFAAGTLYYICWADRFLADPKTDIIRCLNAQTDLEDGDPVRIEAQGTIPAGLTANSVVYYVNMIDDRSGRLYTSSVNAISGGTTGLVDITSTGGGTQYIVGEEVLSNKYVQLFASQGNATTNASRIDISGTSGGTDYLVGPELVGTTLGQIFPSAADVTANTNRIDIADAGTGTHYFDGTTSQTYGLSTFSEGGGQSVESTATTVTNCCSVAGLYSKVFLCWDTVASNNGFGIYGRNATQANRDPLSRVGSSTTCWKVATTSDIDFLPSDIGGVTSAGGQDGILLYYHATNRIAYILPTDFGTDTFPNATTITINGRSETTTGAPVAAYHWQDGGDTATEYPHRTFRWRANTRYMPGEYVTDSSGNFYEVTQGRNTYKTSSQEPTWDTDINDPCGAGYESGVGDLDFRRTYTFMSESPPTSAVNNALFTTVDARSGTTITLAANAGNTVASQYVFHDDTAVLIAGFEAARDDTTGTRTFYVPDGEYPCYLGSLATDTRWTELGTDNYGLFAFPSDSPSLPMRFQMAAGATISVHPLTVSSGNQEDASVDSQVLFALYKNPRLTIEGGSFLWQPPCEPKLESDDGENEQLFFNVATGGGYFYGDLHLAWTRIHGFAKGWQNSGAVGDLDAHTYEHVFASFGAADHDNLGYFEGGRISDCAFVGQGYSRSRIFYTDATDPTAAFHVERTHCFDGKKVTSRIRCDDVTYRDVYFYNCNFPISIEDNDDDDVRDVVIDGVRCYSDVGTNSNGIYVSNGQDVVVHGCMVENGTISVSSNGGKRVVVSDNVVRAKSPGTYQSAGVAIQVAAQNQQVIVADNVIDLWNDFTGTALGIQFDAIGNTDLIIHDNSVLSCNAGITFASLYAGRVRAHDNDFRSANNASVWNCVGAAGTEIWAHHNMIDSATNTSIMYWGSGGRIVVEDTDCRVGFTTATGLTGPFTMRENYIAGTATLAEPSTVIEDNNFAGTVTLSGATQFTRNNSVADVKFQTPSALASGTTDDLALGVTDTHRLDPNASNSTISSIVARGGGATVTIICVDAGAATITLQDAAGTGTAANRIVTPDGADIVLSNDESVVMQYDSTTQRWKVIGGGYSTIFNRDAQRAFEGSWALAA